MAGDLFLKNVREWLVLNQGEERDMRLLLILCFIALLSACDKKVDTPKIDRNDICGQMFAKRWKTLEGKPVWNDFKARLASTRVFESSKRMDISLDYGFRATEARKFLATLEVAGVDSLVFRSNIRNACFLRQM